MSPRTAKGRSGKAAASRSDRARAGAGGRAGAVRCAIYTRKSSEEGLEQDFNSLHAQREACEAYVASQRHEGWTVLPEVYDDGGFSGGSLERPALRGLLAAIDAGGVDVVVVYKVDRLTRSLADFAKIVEVFDAKSVSFVSVTQQFNTTSSMGRLTLNVLLSFAQFEREVTGERIRDKIAASKRKGMWMGGNVPLGYAARDRSLAIDPEEAATVRQVYDLYARLGNVRLVQREADRLGLVSKRRPRPNGRVLGGVGFTRGALYKLLSNPVYAGDIVHRDKRHRGLHAPIIVPEAWEAVQRQLTSQAARARGQASAQSPSLLAGLIVDEAGAPLTPTHANKKGRRYRYYVSRALVAGPKAEPAPSTSDRAPRKSDATTNTWRLPANEIEMLVIEAVYALLIDQSRLMDQLGLGMLRPDALDATLASSAQLADALKGAAGHEQRDLLQAIVERVEIGSERVIVDMNTVAIWAELGAQDMSVDPDARDPRLHLTIPIRLARRGSELKLVMADRPETHRDRNLIGRLAKGYLWFEELRTGAVQSLAAIAEREGITVPMVRRACDLAFLSTDMIEAILAGEQPIEINTEAFKVSYPLPIGWEEQRRVLGYT